MNLKSKKELTKKIKDRYSKSGEKEKTKILDGLEDNIKINRKYF